MKIIFVCTGNTCRSPMAEGLFKAFLRERGIGGVEVLSAGLAAFPGAPASEKSVAAMAEVGIDISDHRAAPLSPGMLDADRILTMTAEQRAVLASLPVSVETMPIEIPDPYGGSLEDYRRCRDTIAAALPEIARRLCLIGEAQS
ncbi:MAG: low molecular weight protein arginine phosphatase [Candidatus Howiella sp.]|jgi:protein-tyrosine-phosphatase